MTDEPIKLSDDVLLTADLLSYLTTQFDMSSKDFFAIGNVARSTGELARSEGPPKRSDMPFSAIDWFPVGVIWGHRKAIRYQPILTIGGLRLTVTDDEIWSRLASYPVLRGKMPAFTAKSREICQQFLAGVDELIAAG